MAHGRTAPEPSQACDSLLMGSIDPIKDLDMSSLKDKKSHKETQANSKQDRVQGGGERERREAAREAAREGGREEEKEREKYGK